MLDRAVAAHRAVQHGEPVGSHQRLEALGPGLSVGQGDAFHRRTAEHGDDDAVLQLPG